MKTCKDCKKELANSKFKYKDDICNLCIEKLVSEKVKQLNKENSKIEQKELSKFYSRRWSKTEKGRASAKKSSSNPEQKEKAKARARIHNKWYSKTEKGKMTSKNASHKRRAQMKDSDITTEWLMALKDSSVHCEVCSKEMNDIRWHPDSRHLDHILPLNKGGLHKMANVRYICQDCNLSRPKDGSDLL